MIAKIVFGILLVVGGFVVYVALQPSSYTISRELEIDAPTEKLFPYINDAKKMDSWNPWTELDPKAKVSFSGPGSGVGAKTSWDGGEKLGTGSATVTESVANSVVKTKLEYVKPYAMTQDAEISLHPNGSQTVVRWSVSGENNFMGRLFCFFMNMDKMIGGTFENGLKKLKRLAESENR